MGLLEECVNARAYHSVLVRHLNAKVHVDMFGSTCNLVMCLRGAREVSVHNAGVFPILTACVWLPL